MSVEYAPLGLIGLLTPQANTTVEPEMTILAPPGLGVLNARLRSAKAGITERLVDYFAQYEDALSEFANAPLGAVGYACTGASYLAGPAREDSTIARIRDSRGIEAITAATAVTDALRVLGARRIVLVSPYFEALDEASEGYWRARGFEVAARVSAWRDTDAFHPIYSLGAAEAAAALHRVKGVPTDAIVMLGTGMPTLGPIAGTPRLDGAPVLSCMLCLGWRLIAAGTGQPADRAGLEAFLDDKGWRGRLATLPLG